MDFQRVLQQSQSYLENAPKQSDATKQLLEQGANFQKTMSGERGIMAAIEAAHLRPKIANYIKGKLNTVSSNDVLKKARDIGTRLTGKPATRGEVAGPRAPPVVTENKVLAPTPNESGLVQEQGFSSLAPGRSISDRFGADPTPAVEARTLTRDLDATNNPLNPRNIANVGQSERVPELDTPENLPGLRGAAAVSREALAPAERIPATTSEQIASLSRSVAERAALPDIPAPAVAATERTGALAGGMGGRRPIIRQGPQEQSLPAVPSMLRAPTADEEDAAAAEVEAQARGVAQAAQARAVPKPLPEPAQAGAGTKAPEPNIEDFPSPPAPARAAQESGSLEEESASLARTLGGGFKSVLGAAGTAAEGLGVVSAFTQKGLTPQQRAGQVAQTLAPRAAGKAGEALDEYGLPKAPAGAGAQPVASDAAKLAQEQSDKTLAEKLATQTTTETEVAADEAAVPGLGDILAIGTAIFGAIRGGVEAEKAKKEEKGYVAPPTAKVAMDNAPTFDSSFR